jgi:transcriptional regulator with XRE-family HTH domain
MTLSHSSHGAHGGARQPAPIEDLNINVGKRISQLRGLYGLSQRELARRADVTNGTISLMEKNKTSPSVGVLKKVLDGFPLSLSDFFSDTLFGQDPFFYKADDLVEIAGGKISYRQVGKKQPGRALQMLHEHYDAGIIISGTLEVTVGGSAQILAAGDAYYFNSKLPHRFRNVGKDQVVIVSACTPASF